MLNLRYVANGKVASPTAQHAADEGYDQQNDRNPEQHASTFRCNARYAAEPEERSDERNDKKDNGPVEKIAHGAPFGVKAECCTWKSEVMHIGSTVGALAASAGTEGE